MKQQLLKKCNEILAEAKSIRKIYNSVKPSTVYRGLLDGCTSEGICACSGWRHASHVSDVLERYSAFNDNLESSGYIFPPPYEVFNNEMMQRKDVLWWEEDEQPIGERLYSECILPRILLLDELIDVLKEVRSEIKSGKFKIHSWQVAA